MSIDCRLVTLAAALALSACASVTDSEPTAPASSNASATTAHAQLIGPNGEVRGRAVLIDGSSGVRIDAKLQNVAPGTYAIHVHEFGRCNAPKFDSAGSHWNPTGHEHGTSNPRGAHKGDLPNVTVGADGTGALDSVIAGVQLLGGSTPVLDADGAAIVLHAGPDDYRTNPSGNSGARIACGVVERG